MERTPYRGDEPLEDWLQRREGLVATMAIFKEARGTGTCRGCGAPVVWAETQNHKPFPFDGDPIILHETTIDGAAVEVVKTDNTHWRSCPHARDFRKRK